MSERHVPFLKPYGHVLQFQGHSPMFSMAHLVFTMAMTFLSYSFLYQSTCQKTQTVKLRFAGAKSRGNPPLSQSLFAIFLVLVVRIAEICIKQTVP